MKQLAQLSYTRAIIFRAIYQSTSFSRFLFLILPLLHTYIHRTSPNIFLSFFVIHPRTLWMATTIQMVFLIASVKNHLTANWGTHQVVINASICKTEQRGMIRFPKLYRKTLGFFDNWVGQAPVKCTTNKELHSCPNLLLRFCQYQGLLLEHVNGLFIRKNPSFWKISACPPNPIQ